MAMVGPAASLLFAGIVAALIVGSSPEVSLISQPLITPLHLMRSLVWLSALLGVLHFVPAYPLDAGRLVRGGFVRTKRRGAGHQGGVRHGTGAGRAGHDCGAGACCAA